MPTPELLERPDLTGDDDMAHLVCCDQRLSVCGLPVHGPARTPRSRPPRTACPTCRVVAQMRAPCSTPDCPKGGVRDAG